MTMRRKEVFVDCREKDLGKKAVTHGATGVIGETKARIGSLENYQVVRLKPGEDIYKRIAQEKNNEYLIIETADWRVIPLENVIAAAQHYSLKIATRVRTAEEARLAFTILQKGVDAVVVDEESEIENICKLIREEQPKVKLVNAKIIEARPIGVGERVCIDTRSMLHKLEGMLIGDKAEGLFLIESETYETPYIAPRPFRVNAGSLNAYVLVPGEGTEYRTEYLSELKSGEEVCVIDKHGNVRVVNIGRIKIETRPMIQIEAEHKGRKFTTAVQNAETIRFVGNKSISLTELLSKPENKNLYLKIRVSKALARHYGVDVDEYIQEK